MKLRSCARHELGYMIMRKMLFVFSMIAVSTISAIGLSSFASANHTSEMSDVHVEGYGDGHCTKCGLKNGNYRCPAFVPTNNHPSICCCGHPKSSHAYK